MSIFFFGGGIFCLPMGYTKLFDATMESCSKPMTIYPGWTGVCGTLIERTMAMGKKEFFVDPLLFKKHPILYKQRIKFPFEMFTPFYIIFSLLSLLSPYFLILILLTGIIELSHRNWYVSFIEFFKFLVLQIIGSFVVVIFYGYGCKFFKLNPLRPLFGIYNETTKQSYMILLSHIHGES